VTHRQLTLYRTCSGSRDRIYSRYVPGTSIIEGTTRNSLKAALFVSGFSPALISIGVARLLSGGAFWDAIYYIIAGAIGCLLIIYILSALKWHGESFPFQAKKVESNDALLLGVIVTYIMPFFLKAADLTVGIVLALTALLWAVFWFTDTTASRGLAGPFSWRPQRWPSWL
jgi:hypothetical protein